MTKKGKPNKQDRTPKDNLEAPASGGRLRSGRNQVGANKELLDDLELAEGEREYHFYPSPHNTQVGSGPYAQDISDRSG